MKLHAFIWMRKAVLKFGKCSSEQSADIIVIILIFQGYSNIQYIYAYILLLLTKSLNFESQRG